MYLVYHLNNRSAVLTKGPHFDGLPGYYQVYLSLEVTQAKFQY
jgi:hypothetical protein